MIDFATTWWIHASLALGIAALVDCIPSVPYTLRDAVWRVGVVVPFVTAAMQSLGLEPVVTTAAIVEPLQVIGNSAPQASTSIDLTHLLFAAWATLSLFGLIRWLADHRALAVWARDAYPVPASISELANEIARKAGLRRQVRVLQTPRATSPVAIGSHTIVLPDRLLGASEDRLRGILGHELGHLLRRDPQWLSGLSLLIALLPFQPLLRLARRAQLRVSEPLCDSLSVQWGADARILAWSLKDVATWQHHARGLPTAAMTRPGGSLTHRIRHLIAGGHAARIGARRLGLTAGACVAAALIVASPTVDANAARRSDTSLQDSADRSPTTEFGALDKSLIDAVIREELSEIRWCYERRLHEEPTLEGKLEAKFRIEPDGRVGHAEVKQTTLNDSAVEQCVLGRLEDLRFPDPVGGGIVIVSYPFVFSAD